ncbi:MAG: hypothetical protein ACTSUQ_00825 [Candidatus Freyarchaeota archaeon]
MSDAFSEKVYRCPLCGHEFIEERAERCMLCPLARTCNLIMCPVCNYEFPKIPVSKGKRKKTGRI